ncbi:MAG: hypothetical protein EBS01_10365 [Verrucomicrobia bacterium]|nr:hypothetical protein [Verrucomicrobiota bacterium]
MENTEGKLLAGIYLQVVLPGAKANVPLSVPANALIFRSDGTQLAVVGQDGLIKFEKVALGRDFGASVEIAEGVSKDARVVLNPPDSLTDGMQVEVVQ